METSLLTTTESAPGVAVETPKKQSVTRVLMFGAGLEVMGGITTVEKLILDYAPDSVSIRHVPSFEHGSAIRNVYLFLRAIAILVWSRLFRTVDVAHIHFSERGSTLRKGILALLARFLGLPYVLHSHGAAYKEFFDALPSVCQHVVRLCFGGCTRFISLSNNWQSYYEGAFRLRKDQLVVFHNPVELPADVPDRSGRDKLVQVVFLGQIGQRGGAMDAASKLMTVPRQDKGAFDLLEAFATLSPDVRSRARLVLAGNGETDLARKRGIELGIDAELQIPGWIDSEQRNELLKDSDVFVLPSYHEGLPMSMLEAMAWGLPVIVTPVGGIPEMAVDHRNGILVEPGNRTQIASALNELLTDESLRLSLGQAARDDVRKLDIKRYTARMADLYKSGQAERT